MKYFCGALSIFLASLISGQTILAEGLLPPARMVPLQKEFRDAAARGDDEAVLALINQMDRVGGAVRAPETFFVEARLRLKAGDYREAERVMVRFSNSYQTLNEPPEAEAVRNEIAAYRARIEGDHRARLTAEDGQLWQAASDGGCGELAAYLAQPVAGAFVGKALSRSAMLDCDLTGVRSAPVAAEAARQGAPVAARQFRDGFVTGPGSGPAMVALPPGSFMMGLTEAQIAAQGPSFRARPQRLAQIGYVLAVGQYEVTFGEWFACVEDGGCDRYMPYGVPRDADIRSFPADRISWFHAKAYTDWLNAKTGLTGRPDRYRLLTDVEWEYAARAGTTTRFAFGDEITPDQARFYGPRGANETTLLSGRTPTVPVGTYPPNAFGLHEMHGNLQEWVEDCFDRMREGDPLDGSAWTKEPCEYRSARGGHYFSPPSHLQSGMTSRIKPATEVTGYGFRVGRTLHPDQPVLTP